MPTLSSYSCKTNVLFCTLCVYVKQYPNDIYIILQSHVGEVSATNRVRNSVPSPNLFLRPYNNNIRRCRSSLLSSPPIYTPMYIYVYILYIYVYIHRKHSEFSRPPAARTKTASYPSPENAHKTYRIKTGNRRRRSLRGKRNVTLFCVVRARFIT